MAQSNDPEKRDGATALDYVKTSEGAKAAEAEKDAAAKAGAAATPPEGGADATHDSPKPHGDKLETARDAAAGGKGD